MVVKSLELDEAQLERWDRWQIFHDYLTQHLFDDGLTNTEFVEQLQLRHTAFEKATNRLLSLIDR